MLLHELFASSMKELLREGNLTHAELGKHYGRYLGMFIDKINNSEPFEVTNPDKRVELGDQVVLDKSAINAILQAYFGQNKIPTVDEIEADSGGKIKPLADPNKVELKTQTGGIVYIGALRKPSEFGSVKGFNTGQIAEGAMGAAMVARFKKREGEITSADVIEIIRGMGAGEESGKNLKGGSTEASKNDKIYFNLVLPKGDYNALYGGVTKQKMHPDMQGVINSATMFANSGVVSEALQKIIQDDFFKDTFGVGVPKQYEDELDGKDPKEAFRIIHEVYASIAQALQAELSGNNTPVEARFVERLYKGIRQHATRGDDSVTMVILKKTPNAPGFTELQFGKALQDAMENTNLTVDYKTPGQGSAIIDILGEPISGGAPQLLVRIRGNFKSEGKGYVRNIVEMGPLLKTLAKIERDQKQSEK